MSEGLNSSIASNDRLSALRRTALLDTQPEPEFDRITKLLCRLLGTSVSLVSFVDQDRQFFKSNCGLPEPWAQKRETPLSHSFCQHVVTTNNILIVEDARTHPLVASNLAIRDIGVIAYLGVPIRAPDGYILGSLCAIESKPRAWSVDDIALMKDMTGVVEQEIELREYARSAADLARENALLAQEYHHRVKNALAVASALVTLSARESTAPKEIAKSMQARLSALADAHDALQFAAESVDLKQLAERILQPYIGHGAKAEIAGPSVLLHVPQITPMCLILHELATNAVKYGAFRHEGAVDLRWFPQDGNVVVIWKETSSSIRKKNEEGFGGLLLETAARGLRGSLAGTWDDGRMQMALTFPAADVAE